MPNNNTQNKMFGNVQIEHIKELNNILFVQNPKNSDATSVLKLNPKNKMHISLDIVEATEITIGLRPIKDAFVRERLPYLNYGDVGDLLAGKHSLNNEKYRSFIDFDLRNVPRDVVFTKCELVLYARNFNNIIPDLELYTVDKHWEEYGITWTNQPNQVPTQQQLEKIWETDPDYVWQSPRLIAKYTDNMTGLRSIRFDLSHIIEQWRKGELLQHGLMLVSSNENIGQFKNFFARESGLQTAPRLLITYYDPNPSSQGRLDYNNKIYIKAQSDKDFSCKIETLPPTIKEKEKDVNCEIEVRNNSYLDSKISIQKTNLDSEIIIENPVDIESKVSVLGQSNYDEVSKINVIRPSIFSRLDVRNNADINTQIDVTNYQEYSNKIEIQRHEYKNINSEILVVFTKSTNCILTVQKHNEIEYYNKIEIRNHKERDIYSEILIMKYMDLDCEIPISNNIYKETDDIITVQNNKYKNILCKLSITNHSNHKCRIVVSQYNIVNTIHVVYPFDLDNNMFIIGQRFNDVNNIINITENIDVNSNINICRSLINNNITIFRNEDSEIEQKINIHNYVETNARIVIRNLDYSGEISVTNQKQFDNIITIRNNEFKNYDCNLIVRRNMYKEINNVIEIHNTKEINNITTIQRWDNYNVESHIVVRRNEYLNIESVLYVYNIKEINSRIAISKSEIDSYINIHHNKDIKNKLIIRSHEEKYIENKILVLHSFIDSNIVIRRHERYGIDSRISTEPSSEKNSIIDITNIKQLISFMSVKIPNASDLISSLEIRNRSIFDSEIIIRCEEDKDIENVITIRKNKYYECNNNIIIRNHIYGDCYSNLSVKNHKYNNINSNLILLNNYDKNSQILVINEVDKEINSRIGIRINNRMFGKVDILPPPEINYIETPIKDSYVRKLRPFFNYGDATDMIVGSSNSGDIFRSYLQFRKPKLPNNIHILDAKIRLYLVRPILFTPNIELHDVNNHWYEQGITWQNAPSTNKVLGYDVDTRQSFIDLDIKDYLKDWINDDIFKNGFALLSSGEDLLRSVSFYTRESLNPPRLLIKYLDLSIVNHGISEHINKIFVTTPKYKDLCCSIGVPSYDRDNDIDFSLNVRNNSFLDSKITAIQSTIDNIIKVKNNIYNDKPSIVSVQDYGQQEQGCKIDVYNNNVDSNIIIKRYDYYDSNSKITVHNYVEYNNKIVIQRQQVYNINTTLHVCRSVFDNTIDVCHQSIINNKLIVQGHNNKDINNIMCITRYEDINGYIKITYEGIPKECDNKIIIKNNQNKDLNSKILVMHFEDVNSKILIVDDDGVIDSKIIIQKHNYQETNSLLDISKEKSFDNKLAITSDRIFCSLKVTNFVENENVLYVFNNNDVNNILSVRNYNYYDVDNELIIVPQEQIESIINIYPTRNIRSKIFIREISQIDLTSQFEVQYGKNQNCIIVVVENKDLDYNNNIDILPTNEINSIIEILPVNELSSRIDTREIDEVCLDFGLEVQYGKNQNCRIRITNHNYIEQDNIIKVLPTEECNGIIEITPCKDLDSNIIIREPANADLDTIIIVGEEEIIGYAFIF